MSTFLYILVALLWGAYAAFQQHKKEDNGGVAKISTAFVLNAVGCPVAIALAIKKEEAFEPAFAEVKKAVDELVNPKIPDND